jgi:serine/threonine protein kinase
MVSRNVKTQLGFLLIVMFLVSFAPVSTATVEPEQTTVDRTFSWSVNSNIRCPGNVAQCDVGVPTGYLASQDFAISTGATHFDISFLEASCSVHNNGPQDAAFDVGVVFGPSSIGFGLAGARPEQALEVYHGVAFGWLKAVLSEPNWSIDFHTGQTNAGGAPVLSTKWLSPTGNVFEGSGMVHLMISVWSGAPTDFDLSVAACSVHVVLAASGVAQGSKTTTVIQTNIETTVRTDTVTQAEGARAFSIRFVAEWRHGYDFARDAIIRINGAQKYDWVFVHSTDKTVQETIDSSTASIIEAYVIYDRNDDRQSRYHGELYVNSTLTASSEDASQITPLSYTLFDSTSFEGTWSGFEPHLGGGESDLVSPVLVNALSHSGSSSVRAAASDGQESYFEKWYQGQAAVAVPFRIGIWVYVENQQGGDLEFARFWGFLDGATDQPTLWLVALLRSSDGHLMIRGSSESVSSAFLSTGAWHKCSMAYDGSFLSVYFDDNLVLNDTGKYPNQKSVGLVQFGVMDSAHSQSGFRTPELGYGTVYFDDYLLDRPTTVATSTSTQQTSSGIARTQTTYVIAIPGVASSMVANPQAVASEITSVAYGKGLTVQVVSSYDQLDSLVRNPPSNVIVINAHGETIPMPASWGASWQTYYDRLASDVSNQGWTFVSIAGYPLYWTISPIQPNPPAPGEAGLRRFLTGVGGQATTAWASTTGTLTSAGSQAASYYGLSFPSTQSFARAVDWQGVTPIVTFYDGSSPVGASAIKMGNGYFITIGLPDYVSDQLKADMGIAFASMTSSIPSFLTLATTHLATSTSTQQQQTSSGMIAGTQTTSAIAAVNVLGSAYILYYLIGLVGVFAPITAYVVTRKGKRKESPGPSSEIQTTDHGKKQTEAHMEEQLRTQIRKMSEINADSLRPGFEFIPDTSPNDRMRVLDSIRGGQGRIIVVANANGDRFAVKTVKYPEDLDEYKKSEKRFYREAALWVGLGKHPNIVRALSFGKMSEDPYLLLEFVDGVNLRKLIISRQLDLRRSLQIGKDVCSGLMYAHSQGVVHGDIKPENILIDRSGRAKVTDFGCSRLSGETGTLSVDIVATLSYMSPEQLFSESEIDERSDIYSFGIVLYEMLTYEKPFRFGTVKEVLNAHRRAHIPVPSSVQMGIPCEIDRLVLRCIERNPDERFRHFGELVAILEKYSGSF